MYAGGKRFIIYSDLDQPITVWNLADLHIGNAGVVEGKLLCDVERIRSDPASFWFGGGDMADFIGLGDKRFDPEVMAQWIRVKDLGKLGETLADRVIQYLQPIDSCCLGILDGNHEQAYGRHMQQQHLTQKIASALHAPYLGYSCFVDLVFVYSPRSKGCPKLVPQSQCPQGNQLRLRVFLHHGAGFAQTPGGKLNKLIQAMDWFAADINFLGHIHDQIVKKQVRLRANDACTAILELPQIGVITGSYLATYAPGPAGYGEQKMYRPVPLGAVGVDIYPGRLKIVAKVEGDLHDNAQEAEGGRDRGE